MVEQVNRKIESELDKRLEVNAVTEEESETESL